MLQPELGPGSRTRSRTASSAGSLDAPPPAAPAGAGAAVSLSPSAQLPPADHGRQAQEDAGEGKEEAVEVGEIVGVSNGSTARVSSNVHGGHGHVVNQERSTSELTSGRAGIRRPHSVLVSEAVCSLHTCTHCCTCHIRHNSTGYGRCMKSAGVPWPDCQCRGQCPPGRCAQYECDSRYMPAGASQSFLPVSPSTPELQADETDAPRSPACIRVSGRVVSSPLRLQDMQAQERQLAEYRRQHHAAQAVAPAAQEAPAAAAAAAPAAVQLPSVATVASHHPLHTTIPFADHTAWIDRCAPALERYRQASFDSNVDAMASSLVELL